MTSADAVLTVDLDAIAANYRTLRALPGGMACAAVVKANAYGLGATEVSRRLVDEGCRTFFVATLDEALGLRQAIGATSRIFVLNGLVPGSEACAIDADITPVLNSLPRLSDWRREAVRVGRRLPAALQVDSGMTRLGIDARDLATLADDPAALAGLELVLLMSHLACADEPSHPANAFQADTFRQIRSLFPGVPASLANSSGMFLGSNFQMDLTRPGAALYGINPTPLARNPMRTVVTLQARVIQTREVPAETAVGYGHTYRADAATRLAVLGIGYADGWRRDLNLGARFEGVKLPRAGLVSMDSFIVDGSACPEDGLADGAWVNLLDSAQTVDDAARAAGTIGYEILCGIGPRVKRRYSTQS